MQFTVSHGAVQFVVVVVVFPRFIILCGKSSVRVNRPIMPCEPHGMPPQSRPSVPPIAARTPHV